MERERLAQLREAMGELEEASEKAQALADSALTHAGMPALFSTERRLRRSSNSTADTGWLFSTVTAWQQLCTSGKTTSALALWAYSGTVL